MEGLKGQQLFAPHPEIGIPQMLKGLQQRNQWLRAPAVPRPPSRSPSCGARKRGYPVTLREN
jgi:hypothetical protein